ncbi:MAG: Spy/CpxP family protein refolding chaperone [Pseudomonadota bacterium]
MESSQSNQIARRRPRLFAGIAVAVVALVAGSALAFAHGMRGMHGGMDPEEMAEHMQVHVKHVLEDVDATPEQQAQIQAIMKSTLGDLKALHERADSAHQELQEVFTAPTIDRARLETLRADHLKIFDEASRRCATALADAADVLTPAQRQKLAQQMEKRREHRMH